METKLKIIGVKDCCLEIEKENGNKVIFQDTEEAIEFLKCWFNLNEYEIGRLFE